MFRTKGRASVPLSAEMVRPLVEADLELLKVERGIKPQPLKRLSQRHHALARSLASGIGPGEAAMMVGIAGSSVSILLGDPSFQDLLKFYSEEKDRQYADMHARLAGLSEDAAELLQQRLEEKPDEVSTGQLMQIVQLGADRTGHGPATKNTNVNINIGMADKLEAARKRVAERQGLIIEGEVSNG